MLSNSFNDSIRGLSLELPRSIDSAAIMSRMIYDKTWTLPIMIYLNKLTSMALQFGVMIVWYFTELSHRRNEK